jgi:methyl-accepting chemotaxis protein
MFIFPGVCGDLSECVQVSGGPVDFQSQGRPPCFYIFHAVARNRTAMRAGWFRSAKFTLGRKLAVIAGTLAVGSVAVMIVAASGMSSMDAAHNDVVNVGVVKQLAGQDARGAAADMHFSQTLYTLDGGAKRSHYLADRQKFQVALNRLVAVSADATDKPLVAAIQSAVASFDRGDVALWALVSAHQTTQATKLVEGAQNTAADTLTAALTAYQKVSAADAAAQTAQFKSTASSSQLLMILVGVGAILLGSLVAFLITRQITRGVRQMLNAADGIAGGDVDQSIDVRSQDELGATAAAFARMIDYLRGWCQRRQRSRRVTSRSTSTPALSRTRSVTPSSR